MSLRKKSFRSVYILPILFFALMISCSKPEVSTEEKKNGTAEMIKILQEVHSNIDPSKVNYFSNSVRAEGFKSLMDRSDNIGEKLNAGVRYSYELLHAGKTLDAISSLESITVQFKKYKVDGKNLYNVQRLLALAYIRLGEENNCVGKKNPDSCIVPIQGSAIYKTKMGSENAIKIYTAMLKENPEDMESIWMLNIAYMTIGEYPDNVPKEWLILPASFDSDFNLPAFPNISAQLGINTVGLSGGACAEDFNNDGFIDIVASSWGVNDQIKIFLNNGDGSFKDHTAQSGLAGITGGLNMVHTDYNNDGFADIFVLRGAWFNNEGKIPNSLLKNNGDGTFSDVTIETGLLSYAPTQTATWADFNLDGWLDLFIGNETIKGSSFPCELYLNQQGKSFKNVISASNLEPIRGFIKGVTSGDINNDGWPDLYISMLNQENHLFLNKKNTDPTKILFDDITKQAGVGQPFQSFPTWMWDYNNDGWLDIFVAGYSRDKYYAAEAATLNYRGKKVGGQPMIYQNNGDGTFSDQSSNLGLTSAIYGMGCNYGDIDNDGYSDFYLGTGAPSFTSLVPNKLYRNNKAISFQDVTTTTRVGHIQKGHGVTFADFDNDGDQDIFHVLGGAFEGDLYQDVFFENPVGNQKNWIVINLVGSTSNRFAIGARVKITAVDKDQKEQIINRVVSTGGSFGSSSLQLEIGIDNATTIKEIEVQWPNTKQSIDRYSNLPINTFLQIKEGDKNAKYPERKSFQFGK